MQKTGKLDQEFGAGGKVSLKQGLGETAQDRYVVSTSPGVMFNDKIIMGTRVSENADAAPGTIQAFDVITARTGMDVQHHSPSRRSGGTRPGRKTLSRISEGRQRLGGY